MLVFKLHLAATLAMTGLIWMVQWVHYPLMADVDRSSFAHYHARHTRRITHLVAPLMLLELATGAWLVLSANILPPRVALIALGLLAVVWVATAALQIPQHNRLAAGSPEDVRPLVAGNWIRTIAWTARSVLLLGWMP